MTQIGYPTHIQDVLRSDKDYYSMDVMSNITRCKTDADYLGDAMLVNERLIWHSVHKYVGNPDVIATNYRMDKDDVLQLGRLGFFKAIMAFDVGRGVKFSSFAVTAIVREVKCYLRDSANILRPTRTANELMGRISRLEIELGYLPNIADIAILLDEQESRVQKAVQIGKTVRYLDEPFTNSRHENNEVVAVTALDLLPDSEDIELDVLDKVMIDAVIDKAREKLSGKEIDVLIDRIAGYNQTQAAERQQMSQMRVSRIMKKAAIVLHDLDEHVKGD